MINIKNEIFVCQELAEIFCNIISCLNSLCDINNIIIRSVERFISSVTIYGTMETHQLTQLENAVRFREQEIKDLSRNFPNFKFKINDQNLPILSKYSLTPTEMASAESCVSLLLDEINENFSYLRDQLKNSKYNLLGIDFALARLKAFQHELNVIFYGCLENMCSFPLESLNIYYEMATTWVYMPHIAITTMDKSGFKMYQETELQSASRIINEAAEYIDKYENDVDNIIKGLKRRDINFFIAGSKSLQTERDVFSGVISILQSQWKPLGININSYSYQSFPRELNIGGHQQQYNNFICKHVNASVFILNGKPGRYTMEEFNVSLESLKKNGSPRIFVYSLKNSENKDDSDIHKILNKEKQYWIEYSDVENLRLLIERDLNKFLLELYAKINENLNLSC